MPKPKTKPVIHRPPNFVAEINGHQIYRAEDGGLCNLFTPRVGWWGFNLTEDQAQRTCEAVAPAGDWKEQP